MGKFYSFVLFFFIYTTASAQYSLTTANYGIQDFSGLGTGTSVNVIDGSLGNVNASLNGWYFYETGTNANTTINDDDGSLNTGNTYNYGTFLMADRTLGGLLSNNLNPTYGFWFTNNTPGGTITSLEITYTGEQWRIGNTGRFDGLKFQYSSDATALNNGTWTFFNPLNFTAPNTTGPGPALNGNLALNRATVTATISGLNIPVGSNFFIRWLDADATNADDGLGIDDFSFTAGYTPASTDYFRSITTGNWDLTTTWEQSPDSLSWVAATSIPTPAANSITISNGHTVTIAALTSADQVYIKSSAVLNHFSGTFTIADGTGNDVTIESGGVFTLSSSLSGPAFASTLARVNVATGGTLRVSASGLTGAGTGVNDSTYVYQHQSVLEYTLGLPFSTSGVTYFPNVNSTTIPIFRTTSTIIGTVGATANTIFNGIFEANGNITFGQTGMKTFRNGIRGSGNIDGSGSGKFIINGATAELGGTGLLTLPAAGLDIGTTTTVTMISAKTVSGNIALLANSYIELYGYNLTVSGTISGGSTTSYVRTNGLGVLTLGTVSSKTFPIGTATTYNPLVISNGGGIENYSARVETGINPALALPTRDIYAIQRTWNIYATAGVGGVVVTFQYGSADFGSAVNASDVLEILQNSGGVWSIIPGQQNRPQTGGPPYQVSTTAGGITIGNVSTPYLLAKSGGFVLPIECIISARAQKRNNNALISWDINSCADVNNFEVQRMNNGIFETIAVIVPDTQLAYSYTDANLAAGANLYRIKVNRSSGAVKYSNTVAILNGSREILITGLFPNPVTDKAMLIVNAGKAGKLNFIIYDLNGKPVKQWQETVAEGSNNIVVNTTDLPGGMYHLEVINEVSKTLTRFVKMR